MSVVLNCASNDTADFNSAMLPVSLTMSIFSGMLDCLVCPIFGARGQDSPYPPVVDLSKNCRRAAKGVTDSMLSVRVGAGRLGDFFNVPVGTDVPLCADMRGRVDVDDDVTFSDTAEVVWDGGGLAGERSLLDVDTV